MVIHTIGGSIESPRELKPGGNLTGVGITCAELTFKDLDHPNFFEWLHNVVLVRLVPEEQGATKPISNEHLRLLGKAGAFNTENLAYLTAHGSEEEKALATRILKALTEEPRPRWTWD